MVGNVGANWNTEWNVCTGPFHFLIFGSICRLQHGFYIVRCPVWVILEVFWNIDTEFLYLFKNALVGMVYPSGITNELWPRRFVRDVVTSNKTSRVYHICCRKNVAVWPQVFNLAKMVFKEIEIHCTFVIIRRTPGQFGMNIAHFVFFELVHENIISYNFSMSCRSSIATPLNLFGDFCVCCKYWWKYVFAGDSTALTRAPRCTARHLNKHRSSL